MSREGGNERKIVWSHWRYRFARVARDGNDPADVLSRWPAAPSPSNDSHISRAYRHRPVLTDDIRARADTPLRRRCLTIRNERSRRDGRDDATRDGEEGDEEELVKNRMYRLVIARRERVATRAHTTRTTYLGILAVGRGRGQQRRAGVRETGTEIRYRGARVRTCYVRPCAALGRHVSKSRRGRTLSGQIRTRGAAERTYTYTRRGTHTRVERRARERDGERTHTTALTNPRQPCRGISAAPPNGRHGTSPTPA